jgi:hypothetical protein
VRTKLLIFCSLFITQLSFAEWQSIGHTKTGAIEYFVETDSIKTSDAKFELSLLLNHPNSRYGYKSKVAAISGNCNQLSFYRSNITSYSQTMGKGEIFSVINDKSRMGRLEMGSGALGAYLRKTCLKLFIDS